MPRVSCVSCVHVDSDAVRVVRDSPIGVALCETTVLKGTCTHPRSAMPCSNWFGSCGAARLAWLLPALPPAPAGQSPPRSREVATGCRSRRGASNVVSLEHPRRGRTRGAAGEDTGDLGFGTPPNRSRRLPRPQVARVTAPTLHRPAWREDDEVQSSFRISGVCDVVAGCGSAQSCSAIYA